MELLTFQELWNHLCQGAESVLIEAKRGSDVGKSCFETVSAFSNEPDAGGGYIMFGVEQRRNSLFPDYEVTGVQNVDQLKCDFVTQCRENFSIPIRPTVTVEMDSGKAVVIAYVPEANAHQKPVHIKTRGVQHGSYRRIAGTDQICTDDDLALFYQSRGQRSVDETAMPDTSLADVDQAALAVYRQARRNAQTVGAAEFSAYSDEELLHAVGGSCSSGGRQVLTLAGLALFGTQMALRRHLPMTRVDYIRVDGREWVPDPERRYQTVEKLGPLLTMAPQIVSQVLEDIPKAFFLPEGQVYREDVPVIPKTVIREAIVNALIHRSYHKQQPIQIIRFSNRIEIRNPGYSLVPEERLGEPGSRTRNPRIAAAMHDAGLAETKGTGIRVMREAMEAANLTVPLIDSDRVRDEFRLRLLVLHLLSEDDIRWLARFKHCRLSNDDARALVMVREVGMIDNSTYRTLNRVDTLTASRRLLKLRDSDLLVQRGKGAQTRYEAGPAFGGRQKRRQSVEEKALENALRGEIDALRGEVEPLRGEMTDDLRGELDKLSKRANPSEIDELVLRLCGWTPLTLRQLAGLLGRSPKHIQDRHIGRLIKGRKLNYLHPEDVTSPNQKYVTIEEP